MVRRGEADDFQSRTGAEGNTHRQHARAHSDFAGAVLDGCALRELSAPLMIQVKISGSASQKSLSGGRTGSWCASISDHIASRDCR